MIYLLSRGVTGLSTANLRNIFSRSGFTIIVRVNIIPVHLQALKLTHFKNYDQLSYRPGQSINIIHGLNGAGKTNLLDAIYYLGMTKSFFRSSDKSGVKHERSFFRLDGQFIHDSESIRVVIKYNLADRKQLERNGVKLKKLTGHIGAIPVVMIAPDDMVLVNGDQSERRRLINNTISQTSYPYLEQLMIYNRLLGQRNQLLKDSAQTKMYDETLLESFDQRMDAPAAIIRDQRISFFSRFNLAVSGIYQQISGMSEIAESHYEPSWKNEKLSVGLEANRQLDKTLQRTSIGPQKDRIRFFLGKHDLKAYGSQGQKKSFIFALRLAQYRYIHEVTGKSPLLLLDDIFDKLDPIRLTRLIDILISGNFGQIFITDTQLERVGKEFRERKVDFMAFPIDKDQKL